MNPGDFPSDPQRTDESSDRHQNVYRYLGAHKELIYSNRLVTVTSSKGGSWEEFKEIPRTKIDEPLGARKHTADSLDRTMEALMLATRLVTDWHEQDGPTATPPNFLASIGFVQVDDYEPLSKRELLEAMELAGFADIVASYRQAERTESLKGSPTLKRTKSPTLRYDS